MKSNTFFLFRGSVYDMYPSRKNRADGFNLEKNKSTRYTSESQKMTKIFETNLY